jgi:hypothetical protein
LDPYIDRTNERTGKSVEEEDIKLEDAVRKHGGKNWGAVAALVPGRTRKQCQNRWHDVMNPIVDRASGRTGEWVEDEFIKLKNAVQKHGGKDWAAITSLVPGRTRKECHRRWHYALNPSIDQMAGRTGKWAEDEDVKLKNAVQKLGSKNWFAITALIPEL